MKYLIIVIFAISLFSCDKGELPIKPVDRGGVSTSSVGMTSNYKYQIFYSLEKDSIISMNHKNDWDLGFATGANDWQVFLNSANYMGVWPTGEVDMVNVTDTAGADWHYDNVRGKIDSTAIGDWQAQNQVYVIDLGFTPGGSHRGLAKMKILSVSASDYEIEIADLDGQNQSSIIVSKDPSVSRACVSIPSRNQVNIYPDKISWDLLFSQYTHIYHDGVTYMVTGVLLNPFETEAGRNDVLDFSSITLANEGDFNLTSDQDIIGFDWKTFDFGTSSFIIHHEQNYFIHANSGRKYKLHFIDFYNDQGEKGYPVFEFQEL